MTDQTDKGDGRIIIWDFWGGPYALRILSHAPEI